MSMSYKHQILCIKSIKSALRLVGYKMSFNQVSVHFNKKRLSFMEYDIDEDIIIIEKVLFNTNKYEQHCLKRMREFNKRVKV